MAAALFLLYTEERKIKENGLTHDLGEDNQINEIILWENWPRRPLKIMHTHSVADNLVEGSMALHCSFVLFLREATVRMFCHSITH